MSGVHIRLREWQEAGPETQGLRGADLGGRAARELAARLSDAGVIEVAELREGVRVQALAHVGRIQLGEILITVEPKIGTSELLELLRYAYGLRNLRLFEETGFAHTGELLQDLLAAQLLAEVTELAARGLAKKYVPRSEELASPRGRIDFGAVARRGPAVSSTLPCRHHLRSSDHHLNRITRAGVDLAADIAQEAGLRRSLRRLSARLGVEIDEVRLSVDSLARARREVNRLTAAYVPSLQLTELLYACAAVSLDGDATTALPGFLFDMNRFFQALIGRFLADHLPGFDVREEHALTEMMRYLPGLNPRRRRSPTPRPDFVVKKGTATVCLLDAKYRDLWERELPARHALPARDLRSQPAEAFDGDDPVPDGDCRCDSGGRGDPRSDGNRCAWVRRAPAGSAGRARRCAGRLGRHAEGARGPPRVREWLARAGSLGGDSCVMLDDPSIVFQRAYRPRATQGCSTRKCVAAIKTPRP